VATRITHQRRPIRTEVNGTPVTLLTIGRIRSATRGFHEPESFITMIMLDRAGIAPRLPWAS